VHGGTARRAAGSGTDGCDGVSEPAGRAAARRRSGARPARRPASRGFTLIELLLVAVLIAVASGMVALALRDPAAGRLEREGARLVALLESARAEARANGLTVTWQPVAAGTPGAPSDVQGAFRFVGLPATLTLPTRWLDAAVAAQVVGAPTLVLGPDPLIGAQRVVLRLENRRLVLATDGLGPFVVVEDAADAP